MKKTSTSKSFGGIQSVHLPGSGARAGDTTWAGFVRTLLIFSASLILAACDAVVEVHATSNVPARHASVLVTIKEVWFNESAAAIPSDTTWQKFRLDEGRTIDLVDITDGELTRIARDLVVPAGTYRQMRVFLVSRDEALHDSAADLDATYNNQVTWLDDDGDAWTSPLEVLNADQGIGIGMNLKVVEAAVALGGISSINRVHLAFDATRDLTEFRYGGRTGFLLNPTLKAFDGNDVGTILGALNLSQLNIDTATGRTEIQVTAQKLDETLNRRVIIGSTSVSPTGSFVLYPLPLEGRARPTAYDLVIHGPGIRTIIIRDVPVSDAVPGSAAPIALDGLVVEPADSFEANLGAADPVVPRGARVGFYQTLPGEDEPYLIEVAATDPLGGQFARPVSLTRASTVLHGTYGDNFPLPSAPPREGAARYSVAAWSEQYGHGDFADTSLRPASPVSDPARFSVPAIGMPASAVAGTISATVTVEVPGRYDSGVLMVSREGAVVTGVPLDEVLQQSLGSTFVEVPQVPAGTASATFARGLYHLEAWTWNAADPDDTFTRHPVTEAVDLRSTATAAQSVAIR